jgi:membrane-associated protease RseP (regulator of RpoE activity)
MPAECLNSNGTCNLAPVFLPTTVKVAYNVSKEPNILIEVAVSVKLVPVTVLETLGTNVSKTVTGTNFTLTATSINIFGSLDTLYATLTVVGRNTGARLQVPFELRHSAGMR